MKHLLPVTAAIALFVSVSVFAHPTPGAARPGTAVLVQTGSNPHLNQADARIQLRLELEALKKALMAREPAEIRRHLTNALVFRKNRYLLYPEAAMAENNAELKQGIEAYNQLEESKKKTHEVLPHFVAGLNKFIADGNYAEEFAEHTVPMYGYLLRQANKKWDKDINPLTSFTELIIAELKLSMPRDVKGTAKRLERTYDGPAITAEENARAKSARHQ